VVSETLQLDAAGACLFSYLLKAEPDGYSDGLCRACAPYAPAHRTTSHLQGRVPHPMVTTVTTLWEGVLDLWSGHARLLPCLWCEPKGVLRICGDSGDGHDAHDGPLRAYSK
jgi:hypothetical protein